MKANIIAFITAAGELTRLAALPAGRPLQYTVSVFGRNNNTCLQQIF